LQPSDGLIWVIGPRLEGHLPRFSAIQTHPSRCFLLYVYSLGLRRSESWSQIINQSQDFLEQASRHRYLGPLERDIATMADNLGSDLDQLLPQRGQRPTLSLGQRANFCCWLQADIQPPEIEVCSTPKSGHSSVDPKEKSGYETGAQWTNPLSNRGRREPASPQVGAEVEPGHKQHQKHGTLDTPCPFDTPVACNRCCQWRSAASPTQRT